MSFRRNYIHHELPRATHDRTIPIYCRQCGREIMRAAQSSIRSVTKCAICVAKEQGVLNPEDHILTQYVLASGPNQIPVPIATEEELQGGILLLDPTKEEEDSSLPTTQSGGVVGTVKSLFRAFGFGKTKKEQDKEAVETTPSLSKARSKRNKGLFSNE